MYTRITRDQLKEKLDRRETFSLVEALPRRYYDAGHLPGAIHLPHDQVDELAPRLLPDKSREVVVYCASLTCNNSRIAARRLVQLGYGRVYAYEDGKQDWVDAGLPVERAQAVA